jgi:hypothetical protein
MSKRTLILELLNTAAAVAILYAATFETVEVVYWIASALCASQALGLWSYLKDYWG